MRNNNEPCGIRLVRLIQTKMFEIVEKEFQNDKTICLYGTGEYWTAFEHSAYLLKKIFPKLKTFVINHPQLPGSAVGLSVPDKELRKYEHKHIFRRKIDDYIEISSNEINYTDYSYWHRKEVREFQEAM